MREERGRGAPVAWSAAIGVDGRTAALVLFGTQAALLVAHVAAFALTGDSADPREARQLLDFNQEGSLPTFWSAAVMALAGTAALLAAREPDATPWWRLVGLGLLCLCVEELLHAHENLQLATQVDWPVIYAPVLAAGAWAVWSVANTLTSTRRRLLLAGLGATALAVGLELVSSPAIAIDYDLRNTFEENLELAGVSLILLAALRRPSSANTAERPTVVPG
jgi:hypothetical protein